MTEALPRVTPRTAHGLGWIGRAMMTLSVIGIAVPTFLLAVILVWIFSIELGWLPAFGRGQTVAIGYWSTGLLTTSGVTSLILPVATLALYQTAWTAQLVFSQMHSALRAPHMLPARARSFSEWRLATRHALPNSLGPVISLTGLQLSHALHPLGQGRCSHLLPPGLSVVGAAGIEVLELKAVAVADAELPA